MNPGLGLTLRFLFFLALIAMLSFRESGRQLFFSLRIILNNWRHSIFNAHHVQTLWVECSILFQELLLRYRRRGGRFGALQTSPFGSLVREWKETHRLGFHVSSGPGLFKDCATH